MIDVNIEENLFSMLDEETDSEYVVLFVYMMYPTVTNTSSLRYIHGLHMILLLAISIYNESIFCNEFSNSNHL